MTEHDDGVFFKITDPGLPVALAHYRHYMVDNHVDRRQIKAIDRVIERVHEWQRVNPDKIRLPDVDEGLAVQQ